MKRAWITIGGMVALAASAGAIQPGVPPGAAGQPVSRVRLFQSAGQWRLTATIDRQHEQAGVQSAYGVTYYVVLTVTEGVRPDQMRLALTIDRVMVTYTYEGAEQVYDSADMAATDDHPLGYVINRTALADMDASGSIVAAEFDEADRAALINDGLEEWLEGMALSISMFAEEAEFYLPPPGAETGDVWVADREGMGTFACGNISLSHGWDTPVQELTECRMETVSGGESGTARVITYTTMWRPAAIVDRDNPPADRWTVPEHAVEANGQVVYDPEAPTVVTIERQSAMTLQPPPQSQGQRTTLSLTETFAFSPIPADDEFAEENENDEQQGSGDAPPAGGNDTFAAEPASNVEGD